MAGWLGRVLLVVAVLLAQHTALAHELWHAAPPASSDATKPAKGAKLCDLHHLLGTVLGVAHGAPPVPMPGAIADAAPAARAASALRNAALVPHSRGPPALS